MNTTEFIQQLIGQGVALWLEGDKLKCSAPRGVLTPDLQSELSARKEEILAILSKEGGVLRAGSASIVRVRREERMPVSYAQQRLWLLNEIEGGTSAYNLAFGMRLRGVLDREALVGSLEAIVARHESLRTTFEAPEGEPYQRIHAAGPVALEEVDLRGLPAEVREGEAERLSREEARRGFDLVKGPLFRCLLIRHEEE